MLLLLRKIELFSIEKIIKYYKNDNTGNLIFRLIIYWTDTTLQEYHKNKPSMVLETFNRD